MTLATSDVNLTSPERRAADLWQVARALAASAENSQEVAATLAECVLASVACDGCVVASLEGDVLRVEGAAGHVASKRSKVFPATDSYVVRAIHDRSVVVDNQVSATLSSESVWCDGFAVCQIAAAPLQADDRVFGVVLAINSTRHAFNGRDAEMLQRVSELGAYAVRNARLFERERQSARAAGALGEIVRHLNQSLELERVFTLIAAHAADLLGARGATVTMLEGDVLRIVGAAGHAVGRFSGDLPVDSVFSGEALRRRRPVRTSDLRLHPQWQRSADMLSDCAPNAIAAPLLVGDRVIGTVLVYGNPLRDFNEYDEELLEALASHAAVAVENARLYRAAARTTRHAEILAATGRTLASVVSAGTVFEGISGVASQLLGVDGLTVYTIDIARHSSTISHSRGLGAAAVSDFVNAVWNGAPARAIESKEGVFIADLAAHTSSSNPGPLLRLLSEGVTSIAFLPLIVDDTVRGLLVFRWATSREPDDSERELYADFATHVAIALRNAGLLGDVERRAARLAAVAMLQQAISQTELNAVYNEVHRAVTRSIPGISVFAILLADPQRLFFLPQLIFVDGLNIQNGALKPVAVSNCAASTALQFGRVVTSAAPLRAWANECGPLDAIQTPVRSEIAVPVLHGEEALGSLIVQSYDEFAFDHDDEAVLALLARQAGAAIENARLFEAERFARAIAEAAATIARAALGSSSVTETGLEILAAVDSVVPSAGKALGLAGVAGDELTYIAASGVLSALGGLSFPQHESAARLLEGRTDPLIPSHRALTSIHEGSISPPGAIVLPLIAKDSILGVLWTVPAGGAAVSDIESETLSRLATYVALAADVLLLDEKERKRRERERMLATALATMDQPVFILGLDRRIWYANAAAAREYRHSAEQLTDMSFDSVIISAVPARRLGDGTQSPPSSVWMAEHVHRRRDDTQFPASVMLSYIRDDAGAQVGQVVNVRNLTEERRLEEHLRQSEKLAALGELVAGVAHELNNPLAGISAFAQLLLEEALPAEQRESVRLIKREADRAVGVIRDLLIFSRKAGPSHSAVDINEIIKLTLRLRDYSLQSVGIELHLDLSDAIPRVFGDDQRLQQVVLNLVVNSEFAMQRSQSKHLSIATERRGEGVVLSVSDTGAGMTEETRLRIFEPFFTTKPAGQGTGLGLSVSYGIVHAHGGWITVESQPGVGSVFRTFLPAMGAANQTAAHSA